MSLWPFLNFSNSYSSMNMTRITYDMCIHAWESIYGLQSQLFSKNDRLFEVRCPTASHVHRKSGRIKKWREIDTLLLHTTNRKYHMAYLFVPFPVTLDDLEGHSPNAGLIKCNSTNICATLIRFLPRDAMHPRY